MIRILHSADWHLDAPLTNRSPQEAALLHHAMLELPYQIVEMARSRQCDLMLLSGDLFDGPYTPESLHALRTALEEAAMPVFISPGNHDPIGEASPWLRETWPGNVHIFTTQQPRSVALPQLDCRVYGAAFRDAYSGSMLAGFRAEGDERYCVGVFHGDATMASSEYNPVTAGQIADCALDYLALGHIHQRGSVRSGGTLCAWPGCPIGKGFDELGPKGVLIVTLGEGCEAEFVPLDTPRFFDLKTDVEGDAESAVHAVLGTAAYKDFCRVTLTGESEPLDLAALRARFPEYPHLQLRDRTVPPLDLWAGVGEDTLEGTYFRLLQEAMEGQDEATCRRIRLAAKISRQLLQGQEVKLP